MVRGLLTASTRLGSVNGVGTLLITYQPDGTAGRRTLYEVAGPDLQAWQQIRNRAQVEPYSFVVAIDAADEPGGDHWIRVVRAQRVLDVQPIPDLETPAGAASLGPETWTLW